MARLLRKIAVGLAVSCAVAPVGVKPLSLGPARVRLAESDEKYIVADSLTCSSDYIVEGYGCVSAELADYGIDKGAYLLGSKASQALMISENANRVYLYVYSSSADKFYNMVSISDNREIDPADPDTYIEDFQDRSLRLVSYSYDGYFRKYLIDDYTPSLGSGGARAYTVRELWNTEHRDDMTYIMEVGLTFLLTRDVNTGTDKTQALNVRHVVIDSKMLAFDTTRQSGAMSHEYDQHYYVAFNFLPEKGNEIDDIVKMRVSYNAYEYSCLTSIEDVPGSTYTHFMDNFHGVTTCTGLIRKDVEKKRVQYVEQGEFTIKSHLGFFATKTYKWNTIQKVAEYEYATNEIKGYKWLAHFLTNTFYASSVTNRDITTRYDGGLLDISRHNWVNQAMSTTPKKYTVGASYYQNFDLYADNAYSVSSTYERIEDKAKPVEVSDLTILDIWYLEEGAVKHSIVVDKYDNSKGHIESQTPPTEGIIAEIQRWFTSQFGAIFNKLGQLLAKYWWVALILALFIVIPLFNVLVSAITTLPKIVKTLLYILFSPFWLIYWIFKGLKWLFTRPTAKQWAPEEKRK